MALNNNLLKEISPKMLIRVMILGAIIALAIISFMIFTVNEPDPEWGKYWRIRPLIITPLAGAFGILSFYLKDYIKPQGDFGKIAVFLISLAGFIIALWMGIVLGLDGTLWN